MSASLSRRELLRISGALAAGAGLPLAPVARAADGATPPAATGPARLSFNENPYGPGPAARAAIAAATGDAWKYAVGEEMALRARIAAREGLPQAQVVLGSGSSEILHLAALATISGGGELLTATPTFSLLADEVRAAGGTVREVPLDARLAFDLPAMRAAVTPATRLVYVCNPNNPTGTRVDGAALRAFIASLPPEVTVLVDEAYLELASSMAEHSAVASVKAGANVVVARTFSKLHGLAGLRIGYALARADLAERIGRRRASSLSSLGLAAATASYEDVAFQDESRRQLAEGLALTTQTLRSLGLRYAESHANFVFFDTGAPLARFLGAMRERGFSVGRPFPPYDTWCRVSIGTLAQMQSFAGALRAHFGG